MFRSATFKLTLWYLGLVMAISIIFSVVLFHVASNEISRGLNTQSARIYDQFPVFDNDPILRPTTTIQTEEHRLLLRLVGFNVVVLVCAGFASYLLARRTLEPIEEAHEQQKRFTADVSHELRTPLTALKMESEVALLNPKSSASELRHTLSSNLEEADKLETLINSLLRLTRLEADELRQGFMRLSSLTIAEQALDQTKKVAKNRHIKLVNDVHDMPLYGDADSLVQLLVILLDNAIKYSPTGAEIKLSAAHNGAYTTLAVEDHGSGIEKSALQHVFDRFYRADNSRTKASTEGFGLGLSIAQMIVDHHGGVITLRSQVDKGTTVLIELPATEKH